MTPVLLVALIAVVSSLCCFALATVIALSPAVAIATLFDWARFALASKFDPFLAAAVVEIGTDVNYEDVFSTLFN